MPPPNDRPFILQWRSAVMNSAESATDKGVLLALAEFAKADGSDCCPSMRAIGSLASVTGRTVQRSVENCAGRWFTRRPGAGVGKDWRTSTYDLVLPEAADTRSARKRFAKADAADRDSARTEETCGTPVLTTVRESPQQAPQGADTVSDEVGKALEEKAGSKRARLVTFDNWLKENPQQKELLQERISAYLRKVGVSVDFEDLFISWVVSKWKDDPKTYRDWPRVIMRALSEDWHRLWRFSQDGTPYLTPAGEQMRRINEAEAA